MAGFFVAILFFFRVLQVETQVQEALDYASRKTACEAAIVSSGTALHVSAEAYFRKEFSQYSLPNTYIKGGSKAVSLLGSTYENNYVTLKATYTMKVPIEFFGWKGFVVAQGSKVHKWIGDRDDGEKTDYVYVTERGTVYHRDRKCNYLDLSIQTVNMSAVSSKRNKNGNIYYACSDCAAGKTVTGNVYITNYGTCYHTKASCSGLKRTIYLIPVTEAGSKRACSKCGG
jgi:Flp pilus assembly protein TadG